MKASVERRVPPGPLFTIWLHAAVNRVVHASSAASARRVLVVRGVVICALSGRDVGSDCSARADNSVFELNR